MSSTMVEQHSGGTAVMSSKSTANLYGSQQRHGVNVSKRAAKRPSDILDRVRDENNCGRQTRHRLQLPDINVGASRAEKMVALGQNQMAKNHDTPNGKAIFSNNFQQKNPRTYGSKAPGRKPLPCTYNSNYFTKMSNGLPADSKSLFDYGAELAKASVNTTDNPKKPASLRDNKRPYNQVQDSCSRLQLTFDSPMSDGKKSRSARSRSPTKPTSGGNRDRSKSKSPPKTRRSSVEPKRLFADDSEPVQKDAANSGSSKILTVDKSKQIVKESPIAEEEVVLKSPTTIHKDSEKSNEILSGYIVSSVPTTPSVEPVGGYSPTTISEPPATDENQDPNNIPPFGLNNLHNTCYMNSFLQALFALKSLMMKLMEAFHKTTNQTKLPMLRALLKLHGRYLEAQQSNLSGKKDDDNCRSLCSILDSDLEEFKSHVGSEKECFQTNHQQDAVEFGGLILEKLEEEWQESCKLPGNESLAEEYSLQKCFQVIFNTTLKCKCNTASTPAPTVMNVLPLPVPPEKKDEETVSALNLENEIENYFNRIDTEEVECRCEKCGAQSKHQEIKDQKLPDNLIVQLLRFGVDIEDGQVYSYKTHARVHVTETVQVRDRSKDSDSSHYVQYRLKGIICHYGSNSVNKGHYISYVLNPRNDRTWYKCDDESVCERKLEDLLHNERIHRNGYCYFYSRV
ncbi:Ubiquitin carboxyl-terminal hydrolase 4 [Halotydeus destructor]|nr:Ubiquitin carboxyl-terminal hydrolase 4 [Halotydeus destructor]